MNRFVWEEGDISNQPVRTYTIEQCGDEWCLYNKAKTKVLGKHKTREDAMAQERAIMAQEGGNK